MKTIRQRANNEKMPIQEVRYEVEDDEPFPYENRVNVEYFIDGKWWAKDEIDKFRKANPVGSVPLKEK